MDRSTLRIRDRIDREGLDRKIQVAAEEARARLLNEFAPADYLSDLRRVVLGGEATSDGYRRIRRRDRQARALMVLRRHCWKLPVLAVVVTVISRRRNHAS